MLCCLNLDIFLLRLYPERVEADEAFQNMLNKDDFYAPATEDEIVAVQKLVFGKY